MVPADNASGNYFLGRPNGWESMEDSVFVVSLLTAPASVHVNSGGTVYTYEAPVGASAQAIPMNVGVQSFSVSRNGKDILSGTSLKPIINGCVCGLYNFNAYGKSPRGLILHKRPISFYVSQLGRCPPESATPFNLMASDHSVRVCVCRPVSHHRRWEQCLLPLVLPRRRQSLHLAHPQRRSPQAPRALRAPPPLQLPLLAQAALQLPLVKDTPPQSRAHSPPLLPRRRPKPRRSRCLPRRVHRQAVETAEVELAATKPALVEPGQETTLDSASSAVNTATVPRGLALVLSTEHPFQRHRLLGFEEFP